MVGRRIGHLPNRNYHNNAIQILVSFHLFSGVPTNRKS